MCYTPVVSLTTAIIEWVLAFTLLFAYRKSALRPYAFFILALLGAYQFGEYRLCVTGQAEFWGTFAFLSYTFLPALGLHAVLSYLRKHVSLMLVYAPPIVFSLVALSLRPFIAQGTCEPLFVTILTFFSWGIPWVFYVSYYFGFILAIFVLLARAYRHEHGRRKKACAAMFAAILLMFIPTVLLVVLFPSLRMQFPSVLCHFALLTTAAFYIAVYYDAKT